MHPFDRNSPKIPAISAEWAKRAPAIVMKYICLFIIIFGYVFHTAQGQQLPETASGIPTGVVWSAPETLEEGRRQLVEMRRSGIHAIRSDFIRDRDLLTVADRLGLALYLDLPLERLPAAHLLDSLDYATAVMDTVLAMARVHPSIRHIGLAHSVNTSDPKACAYFERLIEQVRPRAPAGVQFYYTTRFTITDVCAETVDFVLLDVLGRNDPIAELRRWYAAADRQAEAGIGALGTWVRRDDRDGLGVPHSAASQARYLETNLGVLLSDTLSVPVRAVFVHRWQDREQTAPVVRQDLQAPFIERFGLMDAEGNARPAYGVVEGIFTGRQRVFAFDEGVGAFDRAPWTTLLGWSIVLMIGIFYAASPRFRHMVPRYFQAHFFFRESVREGRDVLFGVSTVLLIALGVATGLVLSVSVAIFQRSDAFTLMIGWMPESTQVAAAAVLANPLLFALLAGCGYLVIIIVWTFLLALITTLRYPTTPAQVLMLIVWARWPMLLLLLAAMVLAVTPSAGLPALGLLLGAWLVVELAASVRTLYDLSGVSRLPPHLAVLGFVLHPVVALGIAALVMGVANEAEVEFLVHALTRK